MFRQEITSGAVPAWGIIPYAARHGVVPLVGAIFLGGVFAKVMSTGNNYLFSPATSVVRDVLQRFVVKGAADRQLLLLSRLTVIALGLIALAQSFQAFNFGHRSLRLRCLRRWHHSCRGGGVLLEARHTCRRSELNCGGNNGSCRLEDFRWGSLCAHDFPRLGSVFGGISGLV